MNTKKKGNSIWSYQFQKMAENNQKDWRRGMKERKWKNDNMEEKEKELEGVKRRDRDNRVSVTGTLWHPWTDTACLKAVLAIKRSSVSSCLQNIFIYFFIRSFISLFISIGGTLGFSVKPSTTMTTPPLACSFNTTAEKNQTALKQIDVLFNTVVTSSQGLCVVCLGDNCRAA